MANILVTEWRKALRSFLASVTDKEFSAFLSRADREIYGEISVPVAELHRKISFNHASTVHFTIQGVSYVEINPRNMTFPREIGHFSLKGASEETSNLPLAA